MCNVTPLNVEIPGTIWPHVCLIKTSTASLPPSAAPWVASLTFRYVKGRHMGRKRRDYVIQRPQGNQSDQTGLAVWLCWLRRSWSIGTKVSQGSECGTLGRRIKDRACANSRTRSHQCEPARGEMLTRGKLMWELQHRLCGACCLSQAPRRCKPPFCSHLLLIKAPLQATVWLNPFLTGVVSKNVSFSSELKGCKRLTGKQTLNSSEFAVSVDTKAQA